MLHNSLFPALVISHGEEHTRRKGVSGVMLVLGRKDGVARTLWSLPPPCVGSRSAAFLGTGSGGPSPTRGRLGEKGREPWCYFCP